MKKKLKDEDIRKKQDTLKKKEDEAKEHERISGLASIFVAQLDVVVAIVEGKFSAEKKDVQKYLRLNWFAFFEKHDIKNTVKAYRAYHDGCLGTTGVKIAGSRPRKRIDHIEIQTTWKG